MASRLTTPARAAISNRSVWVQITPRPMNMTESRQIYRHLARFGEVEHFRNLAYDRIPSPGQAFLVFQQEEAAQRCISSSPIRLTIGPADGINQARQEPVHYDESPKEKSPFSSIMSTFSRRITNKPFGIDQSRSMSTVNLDRLPIPARDASLPRVLQIDDERSLTPKVFQVTAKAAGLDLRSAVVRGYYFGRFTNDWRSVPNEDLKSRVPLKGMANLDWRRELKPGKLYQTHKQEHEEWMARFDIGSLRSMYEKHQEKRWPGGE